MPSADIAELDVAEAGFIAARIAVRTSEMHSRLGKRYMRPFPSPVLEVVKGWLGALVTPDMYRKRGVNSQDTTLELLEKDADTARAQMKEAADAVDGLFDLPLADTGDATAIAKGAPMSYSEQSPWAWTDTQATVGRGEDRNR